MNKDEFDSLLTRMVQSADGISDVLFIAGRPPQLEIQGRLKPFDENQSLLTSAQIEAMASFVINNNPRLLQDMKERGSCDCGYTMKDVCRFRVNVYLQSGNYAMVLRHLRPLIPTFKSLRVAPVFNQIVKEKHGIIFVTGGTGMGKTTTMAAMLNEINKTENIHIITLEDPIEFVFTSNKATFSQRELGLDFYDFHNGMRAALRQAPKIVFVGEIRDRETMEIVLNAGETGHLVFTTLHTTGAAVSISRILSMFSEDEEMQVRQRLAMAMRFIISQRLVPAVAGGRLLVTEILGSSLRSREAITLGENEGRRLDEIIEAGTVNGWHSFEQSLAKAFQEDLISDQTAMLYCTNRAKMVQRLDSLNKPRTSGESGLFSSLKMQDEQD